MKAQILFCLFTLVLLTSCASVPVLQVEGRPVPDHVLQASLLQSKIDIQVAFIRYHQEKEGDEFLDTHEYLKFGIQEGPAKVSPKHLRKLEIFAKVLNPRKVEYQLWVERTYICYVGLQKNSHSFNPIYAGNLSRKEFHISLPLDVGSEGTIQLLIRDKDDLFIYQSPKARYEVGKTFGSTHN
jgi:hypothetical protein